ncbi:MAG: TIGR03936 family radical SAM-associated protein [Chloroflexota bacterium]|nr:TIGR03936 family radical SAM-associated protein [Chloroflexota bacterium]
MKVQRLRVTFARGEDLKYITHLDLMRFWERALRRAGLPVAHSEGFSPHAQLSLAAPLPVGTTSDGELMDVFMAEAISPRRFIDEASPQLPPALSIAGVEEVGMTLPALQADVRFAEYLVDVPLICPDGGIGPTSNIQHPNSNPEHGESVASMRSAVEAFLAANSVPWQHMRDDAVRSYDIRAQVERIEVAEGEDGAITLAMRLKNDNTGSGRPEQMVAALGLGTPRRIHRTKLILAGTSPAREAWRKAGRFAS